MQGDSTQFESLSLKRYINIKKIAYEMYKDYKDFMHDAQVSDASLDEQVQITKKFLDKIPENRLYNRNEIPIGPWSIEHRIIVATILMPDTKEKLVNESFNDLSLFASCNPIILELPKEITEGLAATKYLEYKKYKPNQLVMSGILEAMDSDAFDYDVLSDDEYSEIKNKALKRVRQFSALLLPRKEQILYILRKKLLFDNKDEPKTTDATTIFDEYMAKIYGTNTFSMFTTIKGESEFIDALLPLRNDSAFKIFVSTLLIPNDPIFKSEFGQTVEKLSEKYGVPISVIEFKQKELRTQQLLEASTTVQMESYNINQKPYYECEESFLQTYTERVSQIHESLGIMFEKGYQIRDIHK